jgi:hypothetical protein
MEPAMSQEFYPVREPPLTRRRFLHVALAASLAPVSTATLNGGHDQLPGVRGFIERYAVTPADPWALVHAIRGVGQSCRLNGESAVSYVLRTCVRVQEVNARRYLYIPATIEVHSNMFLKTFLEAGVPLSERFACGGRVVQLHDLGEGAKALFRFDPSTVDRDDLAWSLIAFAELGAQAWDNAYGERIALPAVAGFGWQVLEEATRELQPYMAARQPLPQKLPIHRMTCGGTHLCYSLLVAAKHGYLPAAGEEGLQELVRMLLYRLEADPALIERYYRDIPVAPGVELFRAGAKLKVLGHLLECLGYAQVQGLWQPGTTERTRLAQAAQELRSLLAYVMTLDLAAIRRRHAQVVQQVIGDTCHAFRGLSLV